MSRGPPLPLSLGVPGGFLAADLGPGPHAPKLPCGSGRPESSPSLSECGRRQGREHVRPSSRRSAHQTTPSGLHLGCASSLPGTQTGQRPRSPGSSRGCSVAPAPRDLPGEPPQFPARPQTVPPSPHPCSCPDRHTCLHDNTDTQDNRGAPALTARGHGAGRGAHTSVELSGSGACGSWSGKRQRVSEGTRWATAGPRRRPDGH